MGKARQILGIDTRSLAFLRIGLATLVLIDLIVRAGDLRAHYTDFGVLPTWATNYILSYHPLHWSVHLFSGSWQWQAFLFAIAGIAAIAMLLGYRTRWATFITWALLASLHVRHPLILNGGDQLLRMLLFWSIFLPLGEQASIDRQRSGEQRGPRIAFSAATAAIMAQFCLMYWVSIFTKTDPQWTQSGWALYYALHIDHISTTFAKWLIHFPTFLQMLTKATFWIEWIGPVVIFLPCYTRLIRLVVIPLFVGFHLGIALCFHLGCFPWVCILGWAIFLPDTFWNWIAAKTGKRPFSSQLPHKEDGGDSVQQKSDLSPIANGFVTALIIYVFLFSLQVVYPKKMEWFDRNWKSVGYMLGLEQRFDLFAPKPTIIDGWMVAVATLEDGRQVDLMQEGRAVDWDKPLHLSARYPNGQWSAYLFFLKEPITAAAVHRPYYMAYLKRLWKEKHGTNNKIKNIQLYMMLEITPPFPEEPSVQKILIFQDKPRIERVNYLQAQTTSAAPGFRLDTF